MANPISDEAFFDAESPTRGDSRHESINDVLGYLAEEIGRLREAVNSNSLETARSIYREIDGWTDALNDDLCARAEDGSRIES